PAIANISVKEKAGFTEIQIESNSPFTYAMYKTSDPHKVVVELNNIDHGKFTEKIVVGRDGIMEIVPTKIDDPQSLARLDITLTAPAEVKPSLKGNSLILYVLNSSPEVKNVKKEEEKPAVAKISEPQKEEDSSGATTVMVRTNFGGYLSKKVVSVREMRFKDIVPQQYDFSCGAASMATIFKYLYGVEGVKEEEIVKDMIAKGDQDLIKEKGFSLLDMKKYAERHGFQANGYKVKAENLSKLRIPTIVLMNTRGYTHFVVLKGVKDGRAYLADPAAGNRAVPLEEFMESWDSVVFVVYKKTDRDLTLTLNTAMRPPVSNVLRLTERLLVASLMALVVVWTTPAGAFVGIYSDRLEVNGEVLGKAINEKEMNSLRGTYMGFNFSVLFEGWWDTLGNYNATLVTGGNTGTAGSIAKASLPEGTQVNIQASVGDLGGSKGIFQITQVP
ncbi:MAG: C39 family peptidase, partial [Nitrospirae bacterium]|nr:C39 family peptidase [Nitrospirota bacterium]